MSAKGVDSREALLPLPPRSDEELVPVRVRRLDQFDLPLARPALERLFALDGVAHVEMFFVPDEAGDAVERGKVRAGP